MALEEGIQKNKKDYSNVRVAMIIAVFACFILCSAAAFFGLVWWAFQTNTAGTSQSDSMDATPQEDILQAVSTDPDWEVLFDEEFNDNQNEWYLEPYEDDDLTFNRSIENG